MIREEVITDETLVHKLIMDHLRSIQVNEKFPIYTKPIPFPELDCLSDMEMEALLNRLWPGKAISTDFVSDSLFWKENREKVRDVLKDLWRGIEIKDFHFRARLVPLNKKHPNIPRADQIRPIVVNSPLVKILESRLLPKLQKYLS